ncbi:MAG: hypothetical protein WDA09_07790 [Bacteriovoracaceae bacterium]
MDTFTTSEQVEAQNIISLFGEKVETEIIIDDFFENEESQSLIESLKMKEDIFSLKISSADTGLEAGFTILGDQIEELRKRMRKTSFYLTDLENLLT